MKCFLPRAVRKISLLAQKNFERKNMRIMEVKAPSLLGLGEAEYPTLKAGEVLIENHAAAVNRADLMQADGNYPPPPGWPAYPGLEVSGVIADANGSKRFKKGDKVCALLGGGGYGEYSAVPEGMVLPVPEGLSMEECAGLPEVWATVHLNFHHEAGMKKGDVVFIHAAASGLGLAAVQYAKMLGCKVIASSGSDEKVRCVREMGADISLNRKKDNIGEILDANAPDIVLDCAGGAGMGANFAKMNFWGRWIQVAALAGGESTISLDTVFRKRLRLIGSTLRSRTDELKSQILSEMQSLLWEKFSNGELKCNIHAIVPFEKANDAHGILRRNENTGKVILKIR